jgi:putative membrane protein
MAAKSAAKRKILDFMATRTSCNETPAQSNKILNKSLLLVFLRKLAQFVKTFFRDMQPGQKKFLRFLQSWAITTLAVLVAVVLLHGHITYQRWSDLFIASLLLGILNAFVRPILMLLALPLLIFTLGLFTLVINMLLLYFVGVLMGSHFQVDGYGSAFVGALIISIISIALNILTGNARASIKIQRRPPPPKKSDDDDDKPVIDV